MTDKSIAPTGDYQMGQVIDRGVLPVAEVVARVRRIQEVMRDLMIGPSTDEKGKKTDGVHYGIVPGTPKPTLFQPGAELLCTTFRIAPQPVVEDLSTSDSIRYRVTMRGISQTTGELLGEGVGECSSDEEKYRWRRPACPEEWAEAPENLRREKWVKGWNNEANHKVQQVRTSPADIANTVLKMAYKRAHISMTRTVLACSDIFAQDLEDLPAEIREAVVGEDRPAPVPIQPPQRKSQNGDAPKPAPIERDTGTAPTQTAAGGNLITDPQRKRFYAIAKHAGWQDAELKEWLLKDYGFEHSQDITRDKYDEIISVVQDGGKQ